jgi:hypothetical protein
MPAICQYVDLHGCERMCGSMCWVVTRHGVVDSFGVFAQQQLPYVVGVADSTDACTPRVPAGSV